MAHDIFLSYSSKDKVIADALAAALEGDGLRCWVAPRDIAPGADWGDSITKAIDTCRVVILIFSSNSNHSDRVLDEIYYAISEQKTILPFRIENLDPSGAMRLHLSSRHWLDAYQPSWQAHIDQLVKSAADIIGQPLQHPAQDIAAARPIPDGRVGKKQAEKKPTWIWPSVAILVFVMIGAYLLFTGLITDINKTSATSPTNPELSTPSVEPEQSDTAVDAAENRYNELSPLVFDLPQDGVWTENSDGSFAATGRVESIAWSLDKVQGDLEFSTNAIFETTDSEVCVIFYGNGFSQTDDQLFIGVGPIYAKIMLGTPYDTNYLAEQWITGLDLSRTYNVKIKIADQQVIVYLDGEQLLAAAVPEQARDSGKVGLFKYHGETQNNGITFIGPMLMIK